MSAFYAPETVEQALQALANATERPIVLAGGTDLWPQWTGGLTPRPERVLSLHRLRELRLIELLEEGVLRIGAACTHGDLVRSELVRQACPAVAEAAATIGAVQIQNRGTVGGNLINGSPAADLPPPLAAAGAEVELASVDGPRCVALDHFYTGYRALDRRPDELLLAVRVPALPAGALERFSKVGTRRAQAISKVVGACRLQLADGVVARAGIAFGSVAPTVVRLHALEQWLVGRTPDAQTAEQAETRAAAEVQPIDDLRSSAEYRRYVVGRLVRRWIETVRS
jgi:CO/xanthine dehydrogenase FAD-binding subunit